MLHSNAIKLEKRHIIAQTGQYHGCPDCQKLTWHWRLKRGAAVVLKCDECKKWRVYHDN